jgi:ubiquinone/menaquinone biosynthesis C-methylase UbiE
VFTSAVLQHNRREDKDKIVKEICRVLKPGGFYFCTENTFRPDNYRQTFGNVEYNPALDDGYSLTPEGWQVYMHRYGLTTVTYSPPSEYIFRKEA